MGWAWLAEAEWCGVRWDVVGLDEMRWLGRACGGTGGDGRGREGTGGDGRGREGTGGDGRGREGTGGDIVGG